MNYDELMTHMAISKNTATGIGDSRSLEEMIYGQGVAGAKVQPQQPQYSMAEIQLTDGTSQTFMMKASTTVIKHLLKEMRETGYLTMWNDTDVLCIRADQVKQFSLRAFTKE